MHAVSAAEWGQSFDSLQGLSIASNEIGGSLPAWEGAFPQLRNLNLENNNISGLLPAGADSLDKQMTIKPLPFPVMGRLRTSRAQHERDVHDGLHGMRLNFWDAQWLR